MRTYRVVAIHGEGIGPEIVDAALQVEPVFYSQEVYNATKTLPAARPTRS